MERGVDVAVARSAVAAVTVVASAVEAPAARGGDRGDLLDVDVDQLTGPFRELGLGELRSDWWSGNVEVVSVRA